MTQLVTAHCEAAGTSFDIWDSRPLGSATQHATTCPTCGQECEAEALTRGSLWHYMVMLVERTRREGGNVERKLREVRQQSRQAYARQGKHVPSTLRVQATVLLRCVAAGVPLLRQNGTPRGKTDLEVHLKRTHTVCCPK